VGFYSTGFRNMTSSSRTLLGILLVGLFLGPMLGPWIDVAGDPQCFAAWRDAERIGSLLFKSLQLFLLTSAITLPWGTGIALAIERRGLRHRATLRAAMLFGLVLPIPVIALAWQSALGFWIPRLSLFPGDVVWQPWQRGLLPAAWIHAMVGLPWVAAIVSLVLRRTDHAVEDEARMTGGTRLLVKVVLGPRILRAMLAGAVWLAVQTGTEIAITDMMMVRTFAEEAHTQLVIGGPGIRTSLALVLPFQLAAAALAGWFAWRIRQDRAFTARDCEKAEPRRSHPWIALFVWGTVVIVLGVPLLALMVRIAGCQQVLTIIRTEGRCLIVSTATALATGWFTASLARRSCWAARNSTTFRIGLVTLGIALATTPGPILGFGLKSLIGWLVEWENGLISWDFPPIRSLLYDQPSPLPAAWAAVLRLFPLACLLLWPTIKQIPGEWIELAAMDGVRTWKYVILPATRESFHTAVFLVAALAMGEVAAAKIANPPFFNVYILRLFDQMHYGSESSVAALALVQWFLSGILGTLWWITRTSSAKAAPASSRSRG